MITNTVTEIEKNLLKEAKRLLSVHNDYCRKDEEHMCAITSNIEIQIRELRANLWIYTSEYTEMWDKLEKIDKAAHFNFMWWSNKRMKEVM